MESLPHAVPIAIVDVGEGAEARFFAWEDSSAAFMIAANGSRSPVPEVELDGLSVAEVFWALTTPEDAVPDELVQHHSGLVLDGERPVWPEAVADAPRGWALDWPVQRSLAECNNSTFNTAHCQTGGSWAGAHCAFDSNGNFSTDHYGAGAHGTLRYHAAMCIDGGGAVADSLYWSNECPGYSGAGVIWLYGPFASPSYLTFTWIAPFSLGQKRRWFHSGVVSSAPGHRDWATKFGSNLGCIQ